MVHGQHKAPPIGGALLFLAYCLGLTMSPSAQAHYLAVVADVDMMLREGRLPTGFLAQSNDLAVVVDVDMTLREGRLPTGFLAQSHYLAVVVDADMAVGEGRLPTGASA